MRKYFWLFIVSIVAIFGLAGFYFSCQRPTFQHNNEKVADSLVRMSMRALNRDSFALAFHNLNDALNIYANTGNKKGEMATRINLAIVYYGIETFEDAQQELNTVKPYVNLLDTIYQIMYYRIHAIVETTYTKDYNRAITYMHKALRLDSLASNQISLFQDLANLAEIYIRNNQHDKAQEIINNIEQMNVMKPNELTSQYYFSYGLLLYDYKQYDEAYAKFRKCLDYSTSFNQPHLKLQALGRIKSIDSLKNDNKSYVSNLRNYISLNDSLSGRRITNQIARLQEQQKMEKEHQEEERRHTMTIFYFTALSVLAALLAVIFFLLYRHSRTIQRNTQLEVEKLDSEIMLERMQNELLRLKVHQKGEQLKEVQKENMSMSLKLASLKEQTDISSLQTFDETFRLLNEKFGTELRQRFPRLTTNEQRFLCLIKLGMTSQEMMSVLNITSSGLYKMRYRLKKKLNLEGEETIESFLSAIG